MMTREMTRTRAIHRRVRVGEPTQRAASLSARQPDTPRKGLRPARLPPFLMTGKGGRHAQGVPAGDEPKRGCIIRGRLASGGVCTAAKQARGLKGETSAVVAAASLHVTSFHFTSRLALC